VVGNRTDNGRTSLDLQIGDRRETVLLDRDNTVSAEAEPGGVDVMAVSDAGVLLVDRYASIPAGLSMCQAGEERFLRVVSLAGSAPLVALTAKVASCRDDIELADPGLEWDASASTLRINWLSGPSGESEGRTIHIGADGRPQ
jgi:hypothetical protein